MISKQSKAAFVRQLDRFKSTTMYHPWPFLFLSFSVMIISGSVLQGINERVGIRAELYEYETVDRAPRAMPFSIYAKGKWLLVIAPSGRVFRYPMDDLDNANYSDLTSFISKESREMVSREVLRSSEHEDRLFFTLAVDERLVFGQLRGLLNSLANAGISTYGLESRLARVSSERSH